jgi:hypothetical protein
MQRYTTKHLWRMKESEQGEFVRYEDAKQLLDEHIANESFIYNFYKQVRVGALYCITMVMMGIVVAKLIGWGLGL